VALRTNAANFLQFSNYVFVTDAPTGENQFDEHELWVRHEQEAFVLADFPSSSGSKSNHFEVVDASGDEVLVAVMHTFTRTQGNARVEFAIEQTDGFSGCFQNQDDARVGEHLDGFHTWDECKQLADNGGKSVFGMEWPVALQSLSPALWDGIDFLICFCVAREGCVCVCVGVGGGIYAAALHFLHPWSQVWQLVVRPVHSDASQLRAPSQHIPTQLHTLSRHIPTQLRAPSRHIPNFFLSFFFPLFFLFLLV
jgi:hypothetical protein